MLKHIIIVLVVFTGLTIGCAAPAATPAPPTAVPPSPTAPQATAAPAAKGTIRLAAGEAQNVDDIPLLIALDALRQQGYTINLTTFADPTLVLPVLIRGDADIADAGTLPTWSAIAKGAPVRSFVGRVNNTQLLLSPTTLQKCQDLKDKKVVVNANTGTVALMITDYVQQECPGTPFQFVTIPGAPQRAAALLSGAVDATIAQTDDWLQLQKQAPGKFHILVNLGERFPGLQFISYVVRQDFGAQHPELVKAFARELILAYRKIQDKAVLADAIVHYLGATPDDAAQDADAYLQIKEWDVNGGESADTVAFTLNYLQKTGILKNLKPADVADLSYINAVLDEIGRQ